MKKQALTDILDTVEMLLPGTCWTRSSGNDNFVNTSINYLGEVVACAAIGAGIAYDNVEAGIGIYVGTKLVLGSFGVFDRVLKQKYDVQPPTSISFQHEQLYDE